MLKNLTVHIFVRNPLGILSFGGYGVWKNCVPPKNIMTFTQYTSRGSPFFGYVKNANRIYNHKQGNTDVWEPFTLCIWSCSKFPELIFLRPFNICEALNPQFKTNISVFYIYIKKCGIIFLIWTRFCVRLLIKEM